MTAEEIEEMKADMEEKKKNGFSRWSWFAMIEKLAQGDVTKFDSIYRVNFITCLNMLSYWAERDRELARLQKKQE